MWTQTYGEVFKSLLVYLKASCYFIHKWKVFSKNFFKKVFSQYFFSFCPFVLWISLAFWGELILQVFDFLDFCCNHFFIFNIYNAVGQQVDQKLNILLLFLKKTLNQAKLAKCVLIYTMKDANRFNLVYLMRLTITIIFCFVTTLASLQFF